MNRIFEEMKRIIGCLILLGGSVCSSAFAQGNISNQETSKKKDATFDVMTYSTIWSDIIKNLEAYYVDSIDFKKIFTAGISAMLQELDPYTEFYTEEEQAGFKTMTTGEYGGIGSIIMQRGDTVCISEPYEGQPAAEVGLRAGDAILSIDGESMIKKSTSDVSDKLRGQAGSTFRIQVLRPYESTPRFFDITRRKIILNAVPYYGWLNDSIAYISIGNFTDKAADEVLNAMHQMRTERAMKGLVLDLRGNGGGLLNEAVKIVNMFIPKGNIIVETKAKLGQWNSTYRTTLDPIDTTTPIVVLVNRGSASASEILSGVMQDLDRAVIMGERTFGKGLVQSTRNLPYQALLKLTTSKYYIPSGRCIQAIDYTHRNEDGSVGRIPDSLTHVFRTQAGREVRDGGGITPDVQKTPQSWSNLTYNLVGHNHIFDYATRYRATHDSIASAEKFCITDEDYADFCLMLKEREFSYDRQSSKKLKELRSIAQLEGYADVTESLLDSLEQKLGHNLDGELKKFKEEITHAINQEIVLRYHFQRGRSQQILLSDSLVFDATELLNDRVRYDNLLKPQDIIKQGKANKK